MSCPNLCKVPSKYCEQSSLGDALRSSSHREIVRWTPSALLARRDILYLEVAVFPRWSDRGRHYPLPLVGPGVGKTRARTATRAVQKW